MVATIQIFRSITGIADHEIVYNPEIYAAAGGELLVLTMIMSWILTYFFNYASIVDNPLKQRVGYNNLCVGWDTLPAKIVAGPMFALIIFVYSRFCQLDYWRSQLDPTMKNDRVRRNAVTIGIALNALSWFLSIGIFAISPQESPLGHTLSFVQLVVFGYIGYVCNIVEAETKYRKAGSIAFTVVFGIICIAFGVCALTQMWAFKEPTCLTSYNSTIYNSTNSASHCLVYNNDAQMGPVPWWLMCVLDYSYFACMGIQGFFRPAAPSLGATFQLVSDDDYKVARDLKDDSAGSEENTPDDEEEGDALRS